MREKIVISSVYLEDIPLNIMFIMSSSIIQIPELTYNQLGKKSINLTFMIFQGLEQPGAERILELENLIDGKKLCSNVSILTSCYDLFLHKLI